MRENKRKRMTKGKIEYNTQKRKNGMAKKIEWHRERGIKKQWKGDNDTEKEVE